MNILHDNCGEVTESQNLEDITVYNKYVSFDYYNKKSKTIQIVYR